MPEYRSQLGQDRWIIEEVFPGKRGGFFVEIGAGDGVFLSNTYVLEKEFGWSGICVEPGVRHEALRRNRRCAVDAACVAGQSGCRVEFLAATLDVLSGIRGLIDCHRPEGTVVEKETVSLADLLRRHRAPRHIDYLSLDVEGAEWAILEPFPIGEYTFGALTVEHNYVEPKRTRIYERLAAHGYVRVDHAHVPHPGFAHPVDFDDWYVRRRTPSGPRRHGTMAESTQGGKYLPAGPQ
jgi:hypothetical protein